MERTKISDLTKRIFPGEQSHLINRVLKYQLENKNWLENVIFKKYPL